MELSRSIFVHCAVLFWSHVTFVDLIYLGTEKKNSLSDAGLQSRQRGPAVCVGPFFLH